MEKRGRKGGRREEKRGGMDGATAQRSDTRGRAAARARPQRCQQVEPRERERERAGGGGGRGGGGGGRKSVFSPEDYFASHLSLSQS